MDNHPIPQDVTGFQFKLIGNMTVKQFAYLAGGVIFAAILYQLPVNFLIKFPFCAFFALLGTGLAYLPIGGRPMDLMIGNYIKALLRPTQFVYDKTGGQIYYPNNMSPGIANTNQHQKALNPFPKDKLKSYLETLDTKPTNKLDAREKDLLIALSSLSGNTSQQPRVMIIQQPKAPQINPQVMNPFLDGGDLPKPLADMPQAEKVPVEEKKADAPTPAPKPLPEIKIEKPTLNIIKGSGKGAMLPNIPESINLITGIAKDPRGNALSNILIEIKDKDGNPVRAFKTNDLGRFASATPLLNGTYTIDFEDPKGQNKFQKMQVNIIGQIVMPIEATSIDTREELRRSLFNAN